MPFSGDLSMWKWSDQHWWGHFSKKSCTINELGIYSIAWPITSNVCMNWINNNLSWEIIFADRGRILVSSHIKIASHLVGLANWCFHCDAASKLIWFCFSQSGTAESTINNDYYYIWFYFVFYHSILRKEKKTEGTGVYLIFWIEVIFAFNFENVGHSHAAGSHSIECS